jgi:hypothetical protein
MQVGGGTHREEVSLAKILQIDKEEGPIHERRITLLQLESLSFQDWDVFSSLVKEALQSRKIEHIDTTRDPRTGDYIVRWRDA